MLHTSHLHSHMHLDQCIGKERHFSILFRNNKWKKSQDSLYNKHNFRNPVAKYIIHEALIQLQNV